MLTSSNPDIDEHNVNIPNTDLSCQCCLCRPRSRVSYTLCHCGHIHRTGTGGCCADRLGVGVGAQGADVMARCYRQLEIFKIFTFTLPARVSVTLAHTNTQTKAR